MSARLVLAALLILSVSVADEPELMPPWIVAEAPLRPDAPPVHASALLPEQTWSGRAIGTLADAFRQIPGAILQESFGGFEPPRVSIRGSGVQSAPSSRGVTLLLNQLPFGLADGSFNSALLDPLLCDQIAVQRGLDGWRTSPAVAGGALDFRRSASGPSAVRLEGGSFGGIRTHATSPSAAVSLARQDGFREHSGQARTAFFGMLQYEPTTGAAASLGLYHAHARYDVPGPLTLAAAMTAPRSISAEVQRDDPARTAEITRIDGSFVRTRSDAEFEFGAAITRTADDFRQLQANGVTRSRSDDVNLRGSYARRFQVGTAAHRIFGAATAARGWRDQRRFLNEVGGTGGAFARDGLFPTTTTLQFEDALTLAPRLVGTLGIARVDARRDIADRTAGATSSTREITSGATLPAASLRWRFARDNVLFLAASSAAEPPTFDDLLVISGTHPALVRRSQPLATQRTRTWEIGARGRSGPLAWDAAVYRAAWTNEILRLADAHGVARGAINSSPTTHEGIETSARWALCERPWRVTLSGNAVWTHFIFDGDPVYGRNRLAGIPPHFGAADLTIDFPRGAFLAAGSDWTAGRTRVDHAGRLAYGGSARLHARAGWRPSVRWTCFLEIQNLLDRTSIASTAGVLDLARNPAATSIFLPATGRAFTLGLEWRH